MNRTRLILLNRQIRELSRIADSLRNKREELRYKKRRTRANDITLRHVKNKINAINSQKLALTREELALRMRTWHMTHPGEQFNLFSFMRWYKQNQKKYHARMALSLNNLPLNMRRLIARIN